MKSLLAALMLGTVLVQAGPAGADYLEPRSPSECMMNRPEYGFQSRLDAVKREANQCEQANRGEAGWVSSCTHLGPRTCLPVYRKSCAIQETMDRMRAQCLDRYEDRRLREAREKKRRDEQEKAMAAARQADRLALQLPQDVATAVRLGMGVSGGANALSETLTRGGTAGVAAIQQRAVNQFLDAMDGAGVDRPADGGRYGESFPRRSSSQLNQATSVLDTEVQPSASPFGGQSFVGTAYGSIVSQLVQAQANGEISEPMAAIGIAIATWIAYEAGMAELQMKDRERERLAAANRDWLPYRQEIAAETLAILTPPAPAPEPDPLPTPEPIDPPLEVVEPAPAVPDPGPLNERVPAGSCAIEERLFFPDANGPNGPGMWGWRISNQCLYWVILVRPETNIEAYYVGPSSYSPYFTRRLKDRTYFYK